MSRYAYSIAAFCLLVGLMASHWKAYVMGGNAVRVAQQAAALQASEQARAKEQTLAKKVEALDRELQQQKSRNAALSRALDERLRQYNEAVARAEATAPASGTTSPFATIAGECGNALTALANHARELERVAKGLQRYASEVPVKP